MKYQDWFRTRTLPIFSPAIQHFLEEANIFVLFIYSAGGNTCMYIVHFKAQVLLYSKKSPKLIGNRRHKWEA